LEIKPVSESLSDSGTAQVRDMFLRMAFLDEWEEYRKSFPLSRFREAMRESPDPRALAKWLLRQAEWRCWCRNLNCPREQT